VKDIVNFEFFKDLPILVILIKIFQGADPSIALALHLQ
jgi:hypothetical protein